MTQEEYANLVQRNIDKGQIYPSTPKTLPYVMIRSRRKEEKTREEKEYLAAKEECLGHFA